MDVALLMRLTKHNLKVIARQVDAAIADGLDFDAANEKIFGAMNQSFFKEHPELVHNVINAIRKFWKERQITGPLQYGDPRKKVWEETPFTAFKVEFVQKAVQQRTGNVLNYENSQHELVDSVISRYGYFQAIPAGQSIDNPTSRRVVARIVEELIEKEQRKQLQGMRSVYKKPVGPFPESDPRQPPPYQVDPDMVKRFLNNYARGGGNIESTLEIAESNAWRYGIPDAYIRDWVLAVEAELIASGRFTNPDPSGSAREGKIYAPGVPKNETQSQRLAREKHEEEMALRVADARTDHARVVNLIEAFKKTPEYRELVMSSASGKPVPTKYGHVEEEGIVSGAIPSASMNFDEAIRKVLGRFVASKVPDAKKVLTRGTRSTLIFAAQSDFNHDVESMHLRIGKVKEREFGKFAAEHPMTTELKKILEKRLENGRTPMTRQHFISIAEAIRDMNLPLEQKEVVIKEIAAALRASNARFDFDRFRDWALNIPKTPLRRTPRERHPMAEEPEEPEEPQEDLFKTNPRRRNILPAESQIVVADGETGKVYGKFVVPTIYEMEEAENLYHQILTDRRLAKRVILLGVFEYDKLPRAEPYLEQGETVFRIENTNDFRTKSKYAVVIERGVRKKNPWYVGHSRDGVDEILYKKRSLSSRDPLLQRYSFVAGPFESDMSAAMHLTTRPSGPMQMMDPKGSRIKRDIWPPEHERLTWPPRDTNPRGGSQKAEWKKIESGSRPMFIRNRRIAKDWVYSFVNENGDVRWRWVSQSKKDEASDASSLKFFRAADEAVADATVFAEQRQRDAKRRDPAGIMSWHEAHGYEEKSPREENSRTTMVGGKEYGRFGGEWKEIRRGDNVFFVRNRRAAKDWMIRFADQNGDLRWRWVSQSKKDASRDLSSLSHFRTVEEAMENFDRTSGGTRRQYYDPAMEMEQAHQHYFTNPSRRGRAGAIPPELENNPEFQRELKAYYKRHGKMPVEVRRVMVPDGYPKFMSAWGTSPDVKYDSRDRSSNKGKRIHHFGEGGKSKPWLVSSASRGPKFLAYVGGDFKADGDWIID